MKRSPQWRGVDVSRSLCGHALRTSLALRVFFAILTGVLLALSFESFSFELLAFVALAPLAAACATARSSVEAFLIATLSSTITWAINVPWVINVMAHFGGLPFALGVAIYLAMSILLGLFGGLLFGVVLYRLRLNDHPVSWLLAVPASWLAVEYARTYAPATGFPWNLLAEAIIDLTPLVQPAEWIGPYALGFLVALPSATLAWLMVAEVTRRQRLWTTGGVVAVLVLWWAFGSSLVRAEDRRIPREAMHLAALIQPNISQEMRWSEDTLFEIFDRMSRLTERGIAAGAKTIVWPESTIPLAYASSPFFRDYVEAVSRVNRADLLLGSVAEDVQPSLKIWNSAYLVSSGQTIGRYDKIKLVAFGEYVPLRKLLFFAEKLVRDVGNFQFGTVDRPLRGRFSYGMAICYEIVFPQVTAAQVRNGANVLVTITNDAWFGDSAAPHQHLANARMRAIETDRYLLRSATTGISALVDPAGRVVKSLPMSEEGIILAPFAVRQTITPYVRFGDWFAIVVSIALVALLAIRWRNAPSPIR